MNVNSVINGTYENVLEWAKETNSYSLTFNLHETINLPKPNWHEYGPKSYNTSDPYIAVIEGGQVWGNGETTMVITPNNKVLRDMVLPPPIISGNEKLPPLSSYVQGNVATVGWWPVENNFCLWFLEIIPRLYLLEKSGIKIDKYLFGKLELPFHLESLKIIGIPSDKILKVDSQKFHLKAEKLVVPSIPRTLGGVPPKWAGEFTRNKILNGINNKTLNGSEKIYISRNDYYWSRRTVINEDEVMNILGKRGFKKVLLAHLTLEEQVTIFRNAKYIVAPHGAGLVHQAFCNSGTKVLEFSPRTYLNPIFGIMSHHFKLDYYRLICDIKKPLQQNPGQDDIIVNTNELVKILDKW
ncbi:glycosyltransferase family 61 protein [Peribacillus frigoritolerans]|uniref:glycosyltransferase family 61 protein n=1 Tax=Peribacillus frigoritolerans TaxID=450367 RepID=UPI00207A8DB0|nr:glycosyltransferase family 61 protein [Peribacillus frigoritolerans]USK78061.1 glycosyltransferase family 61 protein [Peribacillus frigoritolerans]WJE45389.1 glycosyltransferase family 61 protein [Peribacillus frigoritolerans]